MTSRKRMLCAVLSLALTMVFLPGRANADRTELFTDIPNGAAYFTAVRELAAMGIIAGDENGNFNPDSTITRGEAAAIICRMLGVEDEAKAITTCDFTDTQKHWSAGYVAKASELGIINGYNSTTFGPDDSVTYEQMVKMLVCALGFEDAAAAEGGWPNGYIKIGQSLELMANTQAQSNGQIDRANVAQMVYNSIQ